MLKRVAVDPAKPAFWDQASTDLMRRDRILKRLIPHHRSEWLNPPSPAFVTLTRAILSQQVSVKAADAIWQRFVQACGRTPTPDCVLALDLDALRSAGLSKRKSEYVRDLASHFADNRLQPENWIDMEDEEVVAELCTIRGIGRWTAEMFLIFNLQRPDVLPLDDASLIKAISLHYFSGEPVSRFEAREVSQAWAPWRTVATWYLWRSLNPAAVKY